MELLIDGWEWITVSELSTVGIIYASATVAAFLLRWYTIFKKPEKK